MGRINTTLASLDLRKNLQISKKGASELAAIMLENRSLKIFSKIPILKIKKNLLQFKILDLSHSHCSDTEAIIIGCLLMSNSTLININFGGNEIADAGIYGISNGLKLNSTLQILYL